MKKTLLYTTTLCTALFIIGLQACQEDSAVRSAKVRETGTAINTDTVPTPLPPAKIFNVTPTKFRAGGYSMKKHALANGQKGKTWSAYAYSMFFTIGDTLTGKSFRADFNKEDDTADGQIFAKVNESVVNSFYALLTYLKPKDFVLTIRQNGDRQELWDVYLSECRQPDETRPKTLIWTAHPRVGHDISKQVIAWTDAR